MANQLLDHIKDHRFVRTATVNSHHMFVRYGWEIAPKDGADAIAVGVDFAEVGDDGRLRSVTSLIDIAPAEVFANRA